MKKIAAIITALFIMMAAFGTISFAASQQVDIVLSEDLKNCVFTIKWENTQQTAEVEIQSPSGQRFGTSETPDRTTISDGAIYINAGNAQAGTWKVNITGEKLGRVDISAGELPGSMTIDVFKVEEADGGYKAIWSVSDCPDDLNIEIFADQNKEGYDGVQTAYTTSKPSGETIFQLSNLENGFYYFYVKVSDSYGLFSYAYHDTAIRYEDAYSPEKLENIKAGLLNGDVHISWDGEHSDYKVMLFSPQTHELLAEETTQENSHVMAMPKEYKEVFAGVASYVGGRLGKFELFLVSNQKLPDASVVYPEGSATNQTPIFADVSFNGDFTVSATLNGELMLDESKASGKYQVNLKEGDNTIVFMVADSEGNMRTFLKEIYLDSTPPQLALNKDINNVNTGDSHIYIEGYTEAGSKLYCNDLPIELVNNYFSFKYDLSYGKNEIILASKDVAGNESRYSAVVRRTFLTSAVIRGIIIGITGAVLMIIEIILLIRGARRRKNESAKNI